MRRDTNGEYGPCGAKTKENVTRGGAGCNFAKSVAGLSARRSRPIAHSISPCLRVAFTGCAIQVRTPCSVSAPHPIIVCNHSETAHFHYLPFYGVAMLRRPHIGWPVPESSFHCPLPPLRPSWTDLIPASVGVSCSAGHPRYIKVQTFKVCLVGSVYEIELSCLAGVDEASPEHAKNFASTLSITETHRAPSQMPLRTSGIFGDLFYTAPRPGCCSGYADERPPPADPSIGGGLVASAPLGVPSGHPEGGSEGVPPPQRLESSSFLPFSAVSDPRLASRLRVFRCTRARVGGWSRCWRVRVPRQHAWGA